MVRNSHNGSLSIGFGKIHGYFYGIVKCQYVTDNSDRIVGMSCPVHFAAFNHQEEAVFVFGQNINGFGCHFSKAWLLGRVTVHIISHACRCEHSPQLAGV
ncbi:hypothetical protein D3C76_1254260 [compost metagenome]